MVKAVTPIPFVKARFFDRCGKPLAGGQIYTYEANTTTPKVTYKDSYGLTPNTNPIILDAAGEADIYLDGTYRIRITDRNDVLINDVAKIGSWFSDNLQDTLDDISGAMDDAIKPMLQNLEDSINTAAAAGAGAQGWIATLVKDASGKTQQQINDVSIKNGTYDPVLGSPVRLKLNPIKASFLYGINDPTHLDDNLNNFRGLNNQNAWDDSNIPIGGVAFGRNNVPFAYLSTALGHDCVAYGVASLAGGAGSATGNPDAPSDGTNYGYCSFAWGKDTIASGRISTAFGQKNVARTVHSFAAGFESETGKGSASHPVLSGTAVDDDGDCAFVHGFRAFAYGKYSLALGNFVRAYHGSKVIGSGINAGSILEGLVPKSIVLGSGVDTPTIILTEDDVVANGAFGKVGFNTKYKPRERVEVVIKDGDKIAIRSSNNTAQGGGTLDLQGTLGNGNSASIFRIAYTSPNAGQAYGVTNFYQNGAKAFSLNESGEVTFEKQIIIKNRLNISNFIMVAGDKVLGGQQPAIPNSDGTAADNARAINAILAAMRGHGLIAS